VIVFISWFVFVLLDVYRFNKGFGVEFWLFFSVWTSLIHVLWLLPDKIIDLPGLMRCKSKLGTFSQAFSTIDYFFFIACNV
jgi:hypothetical protein